MNAIVLAAGLGTRLSPLTRKIPKPLIPVMGKPNLGRLIDKLLDSGFSRIVINTHHLGGQIWDFVNTLGHKDKLKVIYEPKILGTGGGIKNAGNYLDDSPFLVINADILTDIDFSELFLFHEKSGNPVTMVLHDYPKFNNVSMENGFVRGFGKNEGENQFAFTGIQVIDKSVLNYIPDGKSSSSIDAYKKIIENGGRINAMFMPKLFWHDLGSFEGYRRASLEYCGRVLFNGADFSDMNICPLKGDGSDRKWYRLDYKEHSMVAVDHGVSLTEGTCEAEAFFQIGRHLKKKNIPVPEILFYDSFSGIVYVKDLGDRHLADKISNLDESEISKIYKSIIKDLVKMGIDGASGFDLSWTWQSRYYDTELVIQKEYLYFLESFVRNYLGRDIDTQELMPELEKLAEKSLEKAPPGFLHRDMQSRNIMMNNGRHFFIDFQAARLGPVYYDLASLLIDPYVRLSGELQKELAAYYLNELKNYIDVNDEEFFMSYELLAFNRNMQILGAFAKLREKPGFEEFISPAFEMLLKRLWLLDSAPRLKELVLGLEKDFS